MAVIVDPAGLPALDAIAAALQRTHTLTAIALTDPSDRRALPSPANVDVQWAESLDHLVGGAPPTGALTIVLGSDDFGARVTKALIERGTPAVTTDRRIYWMT